MVQQALWRKERRGSTIEKELALCEYTYQTFWKPKKYEKNELYRRFALPLEKGGNDHRYPPKKALFDCLLQSRADRILDVACGAGELAIWMALNGKRVWAFDFSPTAIEIARASARLSGVSDMINFQVMDAQFLHYEDQFCDIVTGLDCTHHLIKYPRAITEIRRVLRIGGKALFVEPLAWNPIINVLREVVITYHKRTRYAGVTNLDSLGEHMLTRKDVRFLAEQFGKCDLSQHVVLSVLTRFVASSYRPLGSLGKIFCRGMIKSDQLLQRWLPFVTNFASIAYIQLTRTR